MKTSRGFLLGALSGLLLLVSCASRPAPRPQQAAELSPAVSEPTRRQAPEPLSPPARQVLKSRMKSHVHDMTDLESAIMVLDYPAIVQLSHAIATDVNLSRPITGDATELNAALPEKFFVRQDELRASARALETAAQGLDPNAVASAYGRLSEACVRCHADYRGNP
jgi:cytochrome c556